MCWEIRQRYLPAQAHGRFLLKGEGGRAAAVGGLQGPWSWKPPTPALIRALVPMSFLPVPSQYSTSGVGGAMDWCLLVGSSTLWGCTCSGPDFHPLHTLLVAKQGPWMVLGLARLNWD